MTAPDQLIATTPVNDRVNLLGLTRQQLEMFFIDLGEKRFRAQQVMKWIHHRGVRDFADMTDLSQSLRTRLMRSPRSPRLPLPSSTIRKMAPEMGDRGRGRQPGRGGTDPRGDRATLCVSSQVGCSLDCTFCSTGKQGFQRDLTAAEIIGQVWLAINSMMPGSREGRVVTNVVMMGWASRS